MKKILIPLALCLPLAAQAQVPPAQPSAILVLDGSGSMWGQIDGVNKIVIARDVVANLLSDLPADLRLGLTAYGHRRRGDCSDIETLIEPGTGNRDAIARAVNAINPRGRTPMTRAVVEAAEALRYTEDAATVILVSDGIETCEADPCAIAAQLEAAGIDFTAHVVGFDVAAEPEARAQMQCIADQTGGRFLTADNAEELAAALTEVAATVAAPAPEPVVEPVATEHRILFSAIEAMGSNREGLSMGVVFEVLQGGAVVRSGSEEAAAELVPGDYLLRATRIETEQTVDVAFRVTDAVEQVVEVVFEAPLPPASLNAPATGGVGSTVTVTWSGPDAEGDYLSTARGGDPALDWITYSYVRDGSPLALRLPPEPGTYVIRYVLSGGVGHVLAEVPITVTPATPGLQAPATAPIGATVSVAWEGAGHDDDFLSVAPVGAPDGYYDSYSYVRDGNPLDLRLPTFPGTYEIRYVTGQNTTVFERTLIEVTDVPASLTAADSGAVGGTLSVQWTGPGNPGDYLTIATPSDGANGYVTYAYLDGSKAVSITLPDTPGTYELRLIADGPQARIMASQPLQVR
ncbi:MAG: VWA domain-containing protein [Paracoccaceae bacterium]